VAFEGDRARDLELRAVGYDVVRLSYRQVIDEPERVVGVLATALSIDLATYPPCRPISRQSAP
jgi:very-short-patch-repair endonuclease